MAMMDMREKIKNTVSGTVNTVKNNIKEIDVSELNPIEKTKEAIEKVKESRGKKISPPVTGENYVSVENALKVFYYLMSVDGKVTDNELEMCDSIGQSMVDTYEEDREKIYNDCKEQIQKLPDPQEYYDVIQDGVEKALAKDMNYNGILPPKLLLWEMLSIAYSDKTYDDNEKKLVRYVARKLEIDRAILLEMESSCLTMVDLNKELDWIKQTDSPYLTIESHVNEIEKRKNIIMQSIEDLIRL